jgi:transcriptional regulator with PAS, ATPase and Fis domain
MAPVMVQGESGTGKELVARALHEVSSRAPQPYVAVNCSAIPEHLLEAEFFGFRKGAFTGAHEERPGFFQAAQGGTLFLDEIGDLPLAMQSKLLRAIQERAVRPIGAVAEVPVNVRIVSATHKDLAAEVQQGRFRQDLYYRLNVIQIRLPPLRERGDDLLSAIAIAVGKPRAWVDELAADEAILLAAKVIEVNADFFTRTVMPRLDGVLAAGLKVPAAKAGSTPSST